MAVRSAFVHLTQVIHV